MMNFVITMKPSGMSRKSGKSRIAECEYVIDANSKEEAVSEARKSAAAEGFNGYAITKIKEI
jgi:hypothetical protein